MSLTRFLTVTASTKRAPAISGGKRGTPVTNVASLKCMPLDPVDSGLRESGMRQRLALNTPHELLQTVVEEDVDVLEGDLLVVGTAEYPIRACDEWEWRGHTFRRLIVEDLKR